MTVRASIAPSRRRVLGHLGALALGVGLALWSAGRGSDAHASSEQRVATGAPQAPARSTLNAPSGGAAPAPDPREVVLARAATPDPLGNAYRDGLIITGGTPHRLILFTFDDGPDVRTTPLLLDRLAEADVHAVFFLVASRLTDDTPRERQQTAIAHDIAARGHLIGAHTVNHVQLPLLDDAAVELELETQDRTFEQVFGTRPTLFRPPFGAHSQRIDQLLVGRGYTIVLWNLGGGDFQVRTADDVFSVWQRVLARRELENGERGGIVLLHDTYAWSVDAFERILGFLEARNCELLESGEELYDVVDDPSFFYVRRAGEPPETEAGPAHVDEALLAQRQSELRARTAIRCRSLAGAF